MNAEAVIRVIADVEFQADNADVAVLQVDYRFQIRAEKLIQTC